MTEHALLNYLLEQPFIQEPSPKLVSYITWDAIQKALQEDHFLQDILSSRITIGSGGSHDNTY